MPDNCLECFCVRRDGFIINNSSELINDIVLPQFQNGKGTDDGNEMRLKIKKNIKHYINEKGTSTEKIHTLINVCSFFSCNMKVN